jgi:23S rRNA (uridine2552-2'-O)-methyltransferase
VSKIPGSSGRGEVRVKVHKNKGLKSSSRQWLARQLNDPYVHAAKVKGYRSRAAFKLVELDNKFHFLKKGARILDLGAAPGGWSQVAAKVGAVVVGADVLAMEEIPGVTFFQADLTDAGTPTLLKGALGGPADVVLSDMAAPTTGHRETDHIRTTALVEIALEVAEDTLKPGGIFVAKVFQGGATGALLARIKRSFADVRHVKPPASRSDSVELYMVALGFKTAKPLTPQKQKAPAEKRRSFRKRQS